MDIVPASKAMSGIAENWLLAGVWTAGVLQLEIICSAGEAGLAESHPAAGLGGRHGTAPHSTSLSSLLVHTALREHRQLLVGGLLLLERFTQYIGAILATEFLGQRNQCAITGNLVMLHRLRR
jgi:hypothetical protein